MVNLQCSPDLRMFLCALYAPVCTEYGRMTLPCRRLCLQARSDCYKLLDMFGVSWPQEMDCNRLAQQPRHPPPHPPPPSVTTSAAHPPVTSASVLKQLSGGSAALLNGLLGPNLLILHVFLQ